MDIGTYYLAFLTALDELPGITTIGPSYFSTFGNWALPAFTADMVGGPIGTLGEALTDPVTGASNVDVQGLILECVIHVPINEANPRQMLIDSFAYFRQIIPIFIATFPPSQFNLGIDDMWCAIVPFSNADAFGSGFTLKASLI